MNARPALLFLSRWFPYPPHNGARIRVYNLLKVLSTQYDLILLSFEEEPLQPPHLQAMKRLCRRVETLPYRPFQPRSSRALMGFLSLQPRFLADTYAPGITRRMLALLNEENCDMVVASEIDMLPYLLRAPGRLRILDELEVGATHDAYRNTTRLLPRLRRGLTWWKERLYLRRVLPRLEGCTVVSAVERQRVQGIAPHAPPIEIIPNGIDSRHYRGDFGPPERDTLIYNGALTYEANFDAVAYFLQDIFPLVRARRPHVHLRVTGKTEGVPLERLPPGAGLTLTGYLDDIRPAVARAWMTVVPLRKGGGTRLKILESLALGTPVVTTSKGAEGLDLQDGQHLLIADTPRDFAAAVIRLLEDPALRSRLAENGRRRVNALYDWEKVGRTLLAYLQKIRESHARISA